MTADPQIHRLFFLTHLPVGHFEIFFLSASLLGHEKGLSQLTFTFFSGQLVSL